jgi:hypothetical protein
MASRKKHADGGGRGSESAWTGPAVFGMNVLVHICGEPNDAAVHCPKGCNMVYGRVVSSGDGYDPDANQIRPMPVPGSLVAFEEGMEQVEGHFFYAADEEYRIVHVDAVIVAFPPGS